MRQTKQSLTTNITFKSSFKISLLKLSFIFMMLCACIVLVASVNAAVLVDDGTLSYDTNRLSSNRQICKDVGGTLHIAYKGINSDVWYGNSIDNGATWTKKMIANTTSSYVGIVCTGGDDLTVYYVENTYNLSAMTSVDGGISFGSKFLMASPGSHNPISPSCEADSNGVIHCAVIDHIGSYLYYVNSSIWGSPITVNANVNNEADTCALVVSPNNCVYIIGQGGDEDDLDYWSPCLNGWGDINRVEIKAGLVYAIGSTISAAMVNQSGNLKMYISWIDESDLQFCHGTPGSSFNCSKIDSNESYYPSLSANDESVEILYTDYSGWDSRSDLNVAYTLTDAISFNVTRNILNTTVLYPQSRGTWFPSSNRVTNRHDFIYMDDGDMYYDYRIISTSAPSAPTDISGIPTNIYLGDILNVTASGSVDPSNLTITYYYRFYNVEDAAVRQDWSTTKTYTIQESDNINTIRIYAKAYNGEKYSTEYSESKAVNETVLIRSVKINNTIAYATTNLVGFCNASNNNSKAMQYGYRWYVYDELAASGTAGTSASVSQNADSNSFSNSSHWTNPSNIYDGNTDTYGTYNNADEDYYYENYTTMSNVFDSTANYTIKRYYSSAWHTDSYTIYPSIVDSGNVRVRHVVAEECNPYPTNCYKISYLENYRSGVGWLLMSSSTVTIDTSFKLAETYVTWLIGQTGEYQIPSYTGTMSYGQAAILSCMATDGDYESRWVNSTELYISDTNATYGNTEDFAVTPASVYVNTTTYVDSDNVTITDPDFLEQYFFFYKYYNLNHSAYIASFDNLTGNSFTIPQSSAHDRIVVQLWVYNDYQETYEYLINKTINILNTPAEFDTITASYSESESNRNITVTYTASDTDLDTVSDYSIKWYKNRVINTSFNNLTVLNSSQIVDGQNYTASLSAFDGYGWSPYTNSTIVTAGDLNAPVISGDSLSSSSGSNNAPFTIYCTVSEVNQLVYVKVEITDPNGIATNFSMSPGTTAGLQSRSYTPSTDGTYTFKFYAIDGTGNSRVYDSNLTYTDLPDSSGGGGGGGGSVTQIVVDENTVENVVNSKLKGYISYTYPGDTVYIPYLPVTKQYSREVVITAKNGNVDATVTFSPEISKYFTAQICDIYTNVCSDRVLILEGEQKYLSIKGNLSTKAFADEFLTKGKISGYVDVMSSNASGPYVYNITITKKTMFDSALKWRDKLNSNSLVMKTLDIAGIDALTQKNTYYLMYATFLVAVGCILLVALRFI